MTESRADSKAPDPPSPAIALPAVVLLVLTFALHAGALGAFFVGDDFDFLLAMRQLDGPADTVAFSFWGEWEPVWWLSWYADYALWGARPVGFHLTNVLWYALCVVSLFALVRTAWPRPSFLAWAAALLFLTHPLHDEAVTYLAARGHPMATGLALAALWAFAKFESGAPGARRHALMAGALTCAFLAGLAKETALVLPAWAAALQAAMAASRGPVRWARTARTAGVFAIPAVGTLLLRAAVVGMDSDKLTGGLGDPGGVLSAAFRDLPVYVLLSGLPWPMSFASREIVTGLVALGWVVAAAALAGAAVVAWRHAGERLAATVCGLFGLGALVFLTGLAPVLWADLALRRRYAFTPSVGAALIACALLGYLHARAPRAAWSVLAILAVLGGAASWQRNDLYARSGAVAQNAVVALRGAALDRPAIEGPRDAALLTLPRAYGGDSLSGAYLLHHTDLRSALRYYDAAAREVHYALKCYHAEDYTAKVAFEDRHELRLTVSFRGARAYAAAASRDPDEDRFGGLLYAELLASEPEARRLSYRVHLRPGFWERASLHLYSDSTLTRLSPPEDEPVDLSILDGG